MIPFGHFLFGAVYAYAWGMHYGLGVKAEQRNLVAFFIFVFTLCPL